LITVKRKSAVLFFEKLRSESKGETVYENAELKKFINAVILKNPPAIQTLRAWLSKADQENG
jgi:hypothetical protein